MELKGILETELNKIVNDMNEQKDFMVIEALGKAGHRFVSKEDLYEFIENRCELIKWPNKLIDLKVDDTTVFSFWDTVEYKSEFKDGNYTVTAIMGNAPINIGDVPPVESGKI